jgi:hypothetical protein
LEEAFEGEMMKMRLNKILTFLLISGLFLGLFAPLTQKCYATENYFGYRSSTVVYNYVNPHNNIQATNFMLSEAANVTEITATIYESSSYGAHLRYAIYDTTLNFVAQTVEGVGVGGTWSNITLALGGSTIIPSGQYFLSAFSENNFLIRIASGSTNQLLNKSSTYASGYPSSISGGVYVNYKMYIWANYTTSTDTFYVTGTSGSPSTTIAGASTKLNATAVTTSGTLSKYCFGWDNSGSWVNDSWASIGGSVTSYVASVTETLNSTVKTVHWEYWFNRSDGQYVNSGLLFFDISASSGYIGYSSVGSSGCYYGGFIYFNGFWTVSSSQGLSFSAIHFRCTQTVYCRTAVYTSENDLPKTLVVQSASESCTANTWHTFTLGSNFAWSPENKYFLAVMGNTVSGFYAVTTADASINNYYQSYSYMTLPSSVSPSGGLGTGKTSLYADYSLSDLPWYDSLGHDNELAGQNTVFSVHLKSPLGLSTVAFHFANGTGSYANTTASLSGTEQWSNYTRKIATSPMQTIRVYWTFNDTSNNIVDTNVISFLTTTEVKYYWNTVWVSSTERGASSTFSVKWYTTAGGATMSKGIFTSNNTGADVSVSFSLSSGWSNHTLTTLNATYSTIRWYMQANDTAGNYGRTYDFYIHYYTVEPWDTTSGNQILRNGTAFIPVGYFLERSSETPTFVLQPVGATSGDTGYYAWSQQYVSENAQIWKQENVTLISIYPTMENWILNNANTYTGTLANATGRNTLNQFLTWLQPYGISVSVRFYMVTYLESRPTLPYPPFSNSLISSPSDFVTKYLEFAVNMSTHPNLWLHPWDEPSGQANQALWFQTIANLTMQIRAAGIHNIMGLQWAFCGSLSWVDTWMGNTTNLAFKTNMVVEPHIYRSSGSFGSTPEPTFTDGGPSSAADGFWTYAGIMKIFMNYSGISISMNRVGNVLYNYSMPLMMAAVGCYINGGLTGGAYTREVAAYSNTLAVLRALSIGYEAYTWQRITTYCLSASGNAIRYPDTAGIYALQYFNTHPWTLGVGNTTVSGYSGYYLFANNKAWTQTWTSANKTLKLSGLGAGASQISVFWNTSSTLYPLSSLLKIKFDNGTLVSALSFYDSSTGFLRFNKDSSTTTATLYYTSFGGGNHWQMTFTLYDSEMNNVDGIVTVKLYNATTELTGFMEGSYCLLDGTYTLRSYYAGYLINSTTLTTAAQGNTTINLFLSVLSLTSVSTGYIAFNHILTSITKPSDTATNITVITAGYSGACRIILKVNQNASYVKRNGIMQTGWKYVSGYISVNASSLSIWEFDFASTVGNVQPITGNDNSKNQRVYYPIRIFVMNGTKPLSQVEVKIGDPAEWISIKYINKTDVHGIAVFYLEQGIYFAKVDLGALLSTNATFTVPHENYTLLTFDRSSFTVSVLNFDVPISFYGMILCIAVLVAFGVGWAVKPDKKYSRGAMR